MSSRASSATGERPAGLDNERIGPYRLLHEVGLTGVGTLYLAVDRKDQSETPVAVEIVRPPANDPPATRRLLGARKTLLNLDHPNIAGVLDLGTSEEGIPYLVLEAFKGEPITKFCDGCQLSIKDRIRLFLEICAGIEHAHQNLVLHGQIEPSNVFVTDEGVPKLIDVGISRLLDSRPGEPVRVTAWRAPEYASPELVQGRPLTTASDVYSLGALLYELLTGHRPFVIERKTPDEIEEAICEEVPGKPSETVWRVADRIADDASGRVRVDPDSVGHARSTAPEGLRRILRGELDAIALKALSKDPGERYSSVGQLATDLRNFLTGAPVQAHRGTVVYRARKFLRRSRKAIIVAATVAVSSALVLAVYVASVEDSRARAWAETERAEEAADLIASLFQAADPDEPRERRITARELLDRGRDRIERELADRPALQASMLSVVGRIYQRLGLYDDALPLFQDALSTRRGLAGNSDLAVAESYYDVGSLLRAKGDYQKAESALRRALSLRLARGPEADPEVVRTLNELARVAEGSGDLLKADSLYLAALESGQLLQGSDREVLATVMSDLAALCRRKGDVEEAERLLREALRLRRALLGPEHPSVAATMNRLGSTLAASGHLERAEALLREAVAIGHKVLGDERPELAEYIGNLARVLSARGAYAEAEALQREVLGLQRKRLGNEHPLILESLNRLADLRHEQGDYSSAEKLQLQALALNRRLFGYEHPSVTRNLRSLSLVLADKGDFRDAERFARQLLELDRRVLGEQHDTVAGDLANLGVVLTDLRKYDEAERVLREAVAMAEKVVGRDHPTTAAALHGLGRLLLRTRKADDAEPLVREAHEIWKRTLPPASWKTAMAETLLGEALIDLERYEEAEQHLLSGYEVLRERRPAADRNRIAARERLAKLYEVWGKKDEAAAVLR